MSLSSSPSSTPREGKVQFSDSTQTVRRLADVIAISLRVPKFFDGKWTMDFRPAATASEQLWRPINSDADVAAMVKTGAAAVGGASVASVEVCAAIWSPTFSGAALGSLQSAVAAGLHLVCCTVRCCGTHVGRCGRVLSVPLCVVAYAGEGGGRRRAGSVSRCRSATGR